MRILQVDLDNVKSYRQVSVPFTPGTNAICGHNGAGKSTLLEAIGFALFDFLAVKQDGFVREGEKTATVTVHVTDTDGRAYQVVRRCGGSNQYYIYDPELDQKLTDGKVETVMWLREFLGVEPTTDLNVLFRDAVGVPQGLLTAAFLETAGRRKDVFNPLLRVDEYEQVWGTLRESRRWLEYLIADMGKQIAGLEAELRVLPDLRIQLADLTYQIAQSTQQKTEAQSKLNDVVARKTKMETLKTQLDVIEKEVSQAVATVQTLSVQRIEAQDALERSEAALAVVEEVADAHWAYLIVEDHLTVLEKERIARDQVQQAHQACVHAQELKQQELAHLEQSLIAIADAEAKIAYLTPKVETQARLEAILDDTRRAVERLKIAKETHAQEHHRLMEMEERLGTVQAQLETRAVLEIEMQSAQIELENRNTQRETLSMKLFANQTEYQTACKQTEHAARRLKDSQRDLERAQHRQIEVEAKHKEIQCGLETLAEVVEQMKKVRADIATLAQYDRELIALLATAQTEQESLQTQITVLSMAETAVCPVCSGPLSPEHREELLTRNRARVTDLDVDIAEIQTKQNVTENDYSQKEIRLRELERKVQSLPRLIDAEDIAAQITAHQRDLTERQTEVASVQVEINTLEILQTKLKTVVDEVQPRLEMVTAERDAAQTTVRDLEVHLKALPRLAEADDLAIQIDEQRQVVTEREGFVTDLQDAPVEMVRLEAEVAALGDPRRAYQRSADIAAQRETTTVQHTNTLAKLTELDAQVVLLDAAVATYAGLDTRLATARADREVYAPAHQRYLQHEREAETVAEHLSALDALNVKLQAAKVYKDEKITARDEVNRQYDREAYADMVTQHGMLREKLAGLEASLGHQEVQLRTVQEAITHLDARQVDLVTTQTEQEELIEVQALLEYLRRVFRDAGPAVTRALVEMISLHADRLYTDIMQNYGERNPSTRLRWTEDYDIVLTSLGRDRTFQQLSGGEQMVAALAVRLALLREISAVDVVFFDEPTANLDRDRRANLARQVLNIKDFGQLFIISHDDTFEQDTDFVVRIEKTDGESRVVV